MFAAIMIMALISYVEKAADTVHTPLNEMLVHSRSALHHHHHHHHHQQSLFIHEIVSFYMVFLGIVFKTRLKYSKELLTIVLKIQKLTL